MAHDPLSVLSKKEREVFDLLIQGFTRGEIAHELGREEATIRFRTNGLYHALNIPDKFNLLLLAVSLGLPVGSPRSRSGDVLDLRRDQPMSVLEEASCPFSLLESEGRTLTSAHISDPRVRAVIAPIGEWYEKQVANLRLSRSLSDREYEVLILIGRGKTNEEIAEILECSLGSVKKNVCSLSVKLHARDRTNAVMQALRLGVVTLGDFP